MPESVDDQRFDMIDPDPNLHQLFRMFNVSFFEGCLSMNTEVHYSTASYTLKALGVVSWVIQRRNP